jgi:hypothetical protein
LLHKEKGVALTQNTGCKFQGGFRIEERESMLLRNPTTAGNFPLRETIGLYAGLLSCAMRVLNPTDSVLWNHKVTPLDEIIPFVQ